ncbi:MAG TPA: hypothetical protein VMR66_04355 [Gemmatimonadota bacterium]|nr:hypothetical protein [Gemmatimonadota bacterium]
MNLWKLLVNAVVTATLQEIVAAVGLSAILTSWLFGAMDQLTNLPTPFREVFFAGALLLSALLIHWAWRGIKSLWQVRPGSGGSVPVVNINIGATRSAVQGESGIRIVKPTMVEPREVIRHNTIKLYEFAESRSGIISGIVFEDCTLVGPCIVLPQLSSLTNCTYMLPNGNVEAILWEIRREQGDVLVGLIPVWNCRFIRCRFKLVGFAAQPHLLDRFRAVIDTGKVIERIESLPEEAETGDDGDNDER